MESDSDSVAHPNIHGSFLVLRGINRYQLKQWRRPVDLTQGLPHDLLTDVLRRLQPSPRSLAASRCVCKAWLAVVDTNRLLTDLLPQSLAGIFVQLGYGTVPKHFSLMPPAEIAAFDYLDTHDGERLTIRQDCNGLALLGDQEVPPPPLMCTPGMEMADIYWPERFTRHHDHYLVFDPTVSPHYEVFLIKRVPWVSWPVQTYFLGSHVKEKEWPPSTFVLLVFSSKTNQWEERHFVREGDAARTIGYMLDAFPHEEHRYGVYWRGALYIRQYDFVMRINLSHHKYQVIELPKSIRRNWSMCHLGKSENGVYCAQVNGPVLLIWYLDETSDQINWMLKYCCINLHRRLENFSREHNDSTSDVKCANCDENGRSNATGTDDVSKKSNARYSLLGFHPNEKIVFFHTPLQWVVSYNFDNYKIEDLGCLPTGPQYDIYLSFPYTPLSDKRVFKQQVA